MLEQGNRILVLQHLVKMFLNPAGPFAFGSDADAGGFLIYVVDESLREFTSVYERLRVFKSVWVMSELQFMRFARWAVLRESLVRVGAYEINREMYKSCISGDLLERSGRQMSGQVGSSRVK